MEKNAFMMIAVTKKHRTFASSKGKMTRETMVIVLRKLNEIVLVSIINGIFATRI